MMKLEGRRRRRSVTESLAPASIEGLIGTPSKESMQVSLEAGAEIEGVLLANRGIDGECAGEKYMSGLKGYISENYFETCPFKETSANVTQIATKKKAKEDLQNLLLQAINQARHSDLEFVCKYGAKVYASKLLCLGRSSKLDALVDKELSASGSSVVNVPEIDDPALIAVVEFLYTGDIKHHFPTDWEDGLKVALSAHVLDLPSVEKIADGLLVVKVDGIVSSYDFQSLTVLRVLVDMLNEAMKLKFLQRSDDYMSLSRLAYLLRWKLTNTECFQYLSEESLDLILRHAKQRRFQDGHRKAKNLDEYFLFTAVLAWAASRYGKYYCGFDSGTFFSQIPMLKGDLYRKGVRKMKNEDLEWLPGYNKNSTNNYVLDILERQRSMKEAVLRLVTHIDWARIPPPLFFGVVEPLKLVPDAQLLDMYRCHYKQCKSLSCDSLETPYFY